MLGPFLKHNLKRRLCDGFSIGYNLIFPLLMILILGLLTQKSYTGEITSFQYYSVVTIPYCTVLGLVTAAYAGKDDAYSNTAVRVLASPLSIRTIVVVKIVSCSFVFFCCSITTILISAVIWKIRIGSVILPVIFFYLALSFVVGAIGTMVGLATHNFLTVKNMISIPVSVLAVMAGTFYPLRSSNEMIQALIQISPFTRMNRSLFLAVYDHQSSGLLTEGIVMFLLGGILLLITERKFKKEEYIHGVIPGYEK